MAISLDSANLDKSDPNDERIIKGTDVPPGKWPFAASLRGLDHKGHGCTGSVLTDDTILTAAHCIGDLKPEKEMIYLGEVKQNPINNKSVYLVKKYIPFEKYASHAKPENDFGLIKLKTKINFDDVKGKITKACLPRPQDLPDESKCVAMGWGQTETDMPNVLKEVTLPIIQKSGCRQNDGKICAGFGKKKNEKPEGDTCFGDSGGPLVCPLKSNPKIWLQYGVMSAGSNPCGNGYAYYARLSSNLEWIRKNAET